MAQFQTMLEGMKKAHQLRLESIEVQSDALDIVYKGLHGLLSRNLCY